MLLLLSDNYTRAVSQYTAHKTAKYYLVEGAKLREEMHVYTKNTFQKMVLQGDTQIRWGVFLVWWGLGSPVPVSQLLPVTAVERHPRCVSAVGRN
jgi:hypothetical protein